MHLRLSAPSRFVPVAVLVVVAAAAVAAPAPTPSPTATGSPTPTASPEADRGGALRYALVEPVAIDPAFVPDAAGEIVVDALFDPLTAVRPDGRIVGVAAERWRVSDGGRTFTFDIRPAWFHDGAQVRAHDFVRAFNRVVSGTEERAPAHPELLKDIEGFAATHLTGAPLEGVVAVDRSTLRISLERPRADLPALLSHPLLGPVPPLADWDPERFAMEPIGNGPFRMAEAWDGGAAIELARADDHPRPASLDGVTFALYAGEDAGRLAYDDLLDGAVDVAPLPSPEDPAREDPTVEDPAGPPPEGTPDATASPTVTDTPSPAGPPPRTGVRDLAGVYLYGFVTDRPPFDDPAVRRAFARAMDRGALVGGSDPAEPADALIPSGLPGHRPGACGHCRHDRVRASLLMAGRSPPDVRLLVTTEPRAVAAAEQVAEDVEAATGMQVEVDTAHATEYLDRLEAGEADVFGLRWDLRIPSPDDLLHRFFASRNVDVTNLTRYSSPDVDGLLERARSTLDRTERLALYGQVEQHVLDEVVVTPVWYERARYARAPAVRDLTFDPWGRPDLSRVVLEP